MKDLKLMPKFIGLIGYPVKHSISPYFQQAALDYYQLDICYEPWETSLEGLKAMVAKIREPQNLGANVTVPYKEAVLPLLDEVDELANLIGAVNTIVKRDDKLLGFNTDAQGFIEALEREGHFDPSSKRAVILGAGGAARAVSFALIEEKLSSLVIINRAFERAEALEECLKKHTVKTGLNTEITALPWPSSPLKSKRSKLSETLGRCHLIVNCTTMGMKHSAQEGHSPLNIEAIPKGILVYDLVYNPLSTPLLLVAQKAGANILGGLAMLVYQGAASFEMWTGKEAPLDIMFSKAGEVVD